jgi:hypothetical protein
MIALNPNDVIIASDGIVQNLQKTTFYLRIPTSRDDDLLSKTIPLPPSVNVNIQYRDFDLVRATLIDLDVRNIVRIVQYPKYLPDGTTLDLVISENGTTVLPAVGRIDFSGDVTVTDFGSGVANINIDASPTRSGVVLAASFAGSPLSANVLFTSPFISANYDVKITGTDERIWTYSSKLLTGFTINSNADQALTGEVSWEATLSNN